MAEATRGDGEEDVRAGFPPHEVVRGADGRDGGKQEGEVVFSSQLFDRWDVGAETQQNLSQTHKSIKRLF